MLADETTIRVWAIQATVGAHSWRASSEATLVYPMSSGSCLTRKPYYVLPTNLPRRPLIMRSVDIQSFPCCHRKHGHDNASMVHMTPFPRDVPSSSLSTCIIGFALAGLTSRVSTLKLAKTKPAFCARYPLSINSSLQKSSLESTRGGS
jgi:hypothetical protein